MASEWAKEVVNCGICGQSDSLNAPTVIAMEPQVPGPQGPLEVRSCINYRARNRATPMMTAMHVLRSFPWTLQASEGSHFFGSADGQSASRQVRHVSTAVGSRC